MREETHHHMSDGKVGGRALQQPATLSDILSVFLLTIKNLATSLLPVIVMKPCF